METKAVSALTPLKTSNNALKTTSPNWPVRSNQRLKPENGETKWYKSVLVTRLLRLRNLSALKSRLV